MSKYYTDQTKRDELRRRLSKAILDHKDKRIMVVAHSASIMGLATPAAVVLGRSA